MVPRFCLLLFAELFCLAIVTNSKQTLQEFEEGKKAVIFCHSKKLDGFAPWTKHLVTNFAVILCRCIITTSGRMMASYLEDNFSEELYLRYYNDLAISRRRDL